MSADHPPNTRISDKHLGAYGNFPLPLRQTPELHEQGGKDQVREGHDWPARPWLMISPLSKR